MLRPQRINGRAGVTLIVALVLNTARLTSMAGNEAETGGGGATVVSEETYISKRVSEDYLRHCPATEGPCSKVAAACIACDLPLDCKYGDAANLTCNVMKKVRCSGTTMFERAGTCRFCYQTENWEHDCIKKANCNSVASPLRYYVTNCTVHPNVTCLGRREFSKRIACAWSGGARWGTALILALTLGGFGADRFYLGHWQEGIGKLFSFGGLGVWTLVDALLIAVHHLGPADGSLYL